MDNLVLVRLNSEYCDYLRKFDDKVPYNYSQKKLRPYVGVLFKVKDFYYFAPLTSPKKKHKTMRATIDFLKIDNGDMGAINFNNMVPVFENNIIRVDLDKTGISKSEEKYNIMLKEQLYWLNRNNAKVTKRSKTIYLMYNNGKLSPNIRKRCCNFKLLEEKCLEYNENIVKETVNN
mgnify:CR=1 FL=1